MVLTYDATRLEYLANKVAELTFDPRTRDNLGELALEVLIEREKLEEILESDTTKENKKKAIDGLKRLRSLEKSIVKLYLLSIFSGKKSQSPFMNYIMSKYSTSGVIK